MKIPQASSLKDWMNRRTVRLPFDGKGADMDDSPVGNEECLSALSALASVKARGRKGNSA
jgi:hypothetical protein